jgi:hypothetical protein
MRILIVNPPHPAIGSRIPDDHLPPLGLLSIGGPLIDDGHDVSLFDAEFGPVPIPKIIDHIAQHRPDLLFLGHSGSTSAHPVASAIARGAKQRLPGLTVVYGGVFPSLMSSRGAKARKPAGRWWRRFPGVRRCRTSMALPIGEMAHLTARRRRK